MGHKIKLKKYSKNGQLEYKYKPLHNWYASVKDKQISDFTTKKLSYSPQNSVQIDCQDSYDGSVNLIINDDCDVPRLINTAFSVQENDMYERILRNQNIATNYYSDDTLNSSTRLQRIILESSGFLQVALDSVEEGGILPGGNYVFMFRYCDEDYNETSVICESGIISLFKGDYVSNVVGTLSNESSNKTIILKLTNIDPSYSYIKILYKRSFCDLTGTLDYEYKEIIKPIKITTLEDKTQIISINGYEPTREISFDSIVVQPNVYNTARTQTQVQNMLFFGNVTESVEQQIELQKISYFIKTTPIAGEGVYMTNADYVGTNSDYTNAHNIYYNLGYMPNEMYRFGIVYIYDNDTISSVYNLLGDKLNWNTTVGLTQIDDTFNIDFDLTKPIIRNLKNTKGVFIMPEYNFYQNGYDKIKPIGLKFTVAQNILDKLKSLGIKGYYFVRQKRIPMFIAQGYSIGVSSNAYIPMLPAKEGCFTHTIINNDYELARNLVQTVQDDPSKTDIAYKTIGLVCVDAILNMNLQSLLDGSVFTLIKTNEYSISNITSERNGYFANCQSLSKKSKVNCRLVYIPEDTSARVYDKSIFSTKAGAAEYLHAVRNLDWNETADKKPIDQFTVRGNYTPFIGVLSEFKSEDDFELDERSVYNIYLNYCESEQDWQNAITIRANDKSEYTAISDRFITNTNTTEHTVFRGDCFTGTIATKFQWNFLDYNTPLNNTIVTREIEFKSDTSDKSEGYNYYSNIEWENLNVSDWNAVPIGYTFYYPFVSNYNLMLRSVDQLNVDEIALFGSFRSFYPQQQYTDSVAWKLPDSHLLNAGLSATQTCLPHFEVDLVPYVKHTFDNRIAFSEIQQQGGFQNGYRIFKGLSYQDIDSSYGAIVKLLTFGSNLFCVFEHGCGIVPVNEKALITTTTGQSVHMKGTGVIQSQISVVSQDYGSIHEDSVIVTPGGIYGVDVFAKKIWRFSNSQFTIISDQYVQRFLNDHINDDNRDTWVGFKNVKTHYNNYKGDVMFTFYNEDKCWNLCYNERIGKFITKYSWTPVLSENIQNSFLSFNINPSSIYGLISYNAHIDKGLQLNAIQAKFDPYFKEFSADIKEVHCVTAYQPPLVSNLTINKIIYPKLENGVVKEIVIPYTESKIEYDENSKLDSIILANDDIEFIFEFDKTDSIKITCKKDLFIPWIKIDLSSVIRNETINQILCFVVNYQKFLDSKFEWKTENDKELYNKTMISKLYTHGYAGDHKEIDYLDANPNNQLKPTFWYDKQEPFEFEFVVNSPTGIQKIFNNLVIISNNVEPDSLEISFIGDAYDFNKANIYRSEHFVNPTFKQKDDGIYYFDDVQFEKDKNVLEFKDTEYSQNFNVSVGTKYKTDVLYDHVLNQYYLKVSDDCRDVKEVGRRCGNIEYKEDKWNLTLTPIYYKQKELKDGEIVESRINSTRIRDKWVKIRIKYTGEKLVVISAIQTLMNLSYA